MTAGQQATGAGGRTVVIGIGNEFRRDDGAGPAVIGRLRENPPAEVELIVSDGDPVRLLEAWSGAALAVVVDAVRADPPCPGRLHRFVLDRLGRDGAAGAAATGQVPSGTAAADTGQERAAAGGPRRAASTHGLGLDDAIGLALALDRMPERLIVHAIEAADTGHGAQLTPEVATAVAAAAAAIRLDLPGTS